MLSSCLIRECLILSKVKLLLSSTLTLPASLHQKKLSKIDPQACIVHTIYMVKMLGLVLISHLTSLFCKDKLDSILKPKWYRSFSIQATYQVIYTPSLIVLCVRGCIEKRPSLTLKRDKVCKEFINSDIPHLINQFVKMSYV